MTGFNKLARKLQWLRRNWLSPYIYTGNPTYEPVHKERKCYLSPNMGWGGGRFLEIMFSQSHDLRWCFKG